jgi:PAS domain S-box-containing protein
MVQSNDNRPTDGDVVERQRSGAGTKPAGENPRARLARESCERDSHELRAVPLLPARIPRDRLSVLSILSLSILIAGGVTLSIHAGRMEQQKEDARIHEEFRRLAGDRVAVIQQALNVRMQDVVAVASFFGSSQEVNRDEFRRFAQPILDQRGGPSALEWVPLVGNRDRAVYVRNAREDGCVGFDFREMKGTDNFPVAEVRGVYYPIYYIEPARNNEHLLGCDYGSTLNRLEPLMAARETGEVAASRRLALLVGLEPSEGFYMVKAVYDKEAGMGTATDRKNSVLGFVVGVYNFKRVFQHVIEPLDPAGIDIELSDWTDKESVELLHRFGAEEAWGGMFGRDGGQPVLSEWEHTVNVPVATRIWGMKCTPLRQFLTARRTAVARHTTLWGLTLTGIVAAYALLLLLRKQHLQHQAKLSQISQRRFAGILNSADDAIVSFDSDSHIMLFNRSAERIFGHTANEMLGRCVLELTPTAGMPGEESDRATPDLVTLAAVERAPHSRFEIVGRRKDGSPFPAEASISRIEIEGETIITAILRDLTDKRKLEAQYLQAQKMEVVGQLTGGVAHDFNNLLQVINGYTAIALRSVADKEQLTDMLGEVQNAGEKAADLTRQLLAFSRRQELQPKAVNLNSLVEHMGKMLRRMIGDDVRFVFRPGLNLGSVRVDPGQIEQVLLNMAINARDAMPDGGQLLMATENVSLDDDFVSGHPWARKGEFVCLSVSDTGLGMDQSTQERIFEPFFTTKEAGKGTGLGLATTYGIVNQHGGIIHVYSEVDKGTMFRIYLPIVDLAMTEEAITQREEPTGGAETILVAEDSETVRELVTHILMDAGYTVLQAHDGERAVEVFQERRERIDLVLLDMMMPRLNGRAAYEKIRQIRGNVPFIFSSGYMAGSDHTAFFTDERLVMIPKPYDPRQLLLKVREVLDDARMQRSVGMPAVRDDL